MDTASDLHDMPLVARRQIKIAVLYLAVGLLLGIWMSATMQFQFRGLHAHLNLLGWATLAVTGVVYALVPRAAQSRLASWHFWLHNLGLPVMMVALAALLTGHVGAEPGIAVGALVTTLGLVLFGINVWRSL